MGGRGSSSMSGIARKASASSIAGDHVAKMSDRQFDSQLKSVNANMEKVSDVMVKTADGHTGYLQGTPFGNKADHEATPRHSKNTARLESKGMRFWASKLDAPMRERWPSL